MVKEFLSLDNLPTPSYICGQEGDKKPSAIVTKAQKQSVGVCNSDIGSNQLLQNQDFIKDSKFDVANIFDTLFSGDVLLPSTLPNLPSRTCLSYRNKNVVHKLGVCW